LTDSMPISIVHLSRANHSRVCKEDICTASSKGYYACQWLSVTVVNGVFTYFDISPANVQDIEYLKKIRTYHPELTILGDMAYLSNPLKLELFEQNRLLTITPRRRNQKNYRKQPAIFRHLRKRIETVSSQFYNQFNIKKTMPKNSGVWPLASFQN